MIEKNKNERKLAGCPRKSRMEAVKKTGCFFERSFCRDAESKRQPGMSDFRGLATKLFEGVFIFLNQHQKDEHGCESATTGGNKNF
ncbi:hypothetical protein XO11_07475 [Marinitoga sp. 1138]|nr:hypothetical protein [Marinitoga sp. 1138]